jgi:2-C-methyl-D-erythritol 4-phosphate cytidylyltransferase
MKKLFQKIKEVGESRHPFCTALIAAGGSSQRMGQDKLFMDLRGQAVLERTLRAVDEAMRVDEIIVATRGDRLLAVADLCSRARLKKPIRVVEGGPTRLLSVMAAALEANPETELLAVHDGARPLITPEEFDAVVRQGEKTLATAPALPLKDTVKEAGEDRVICATPDRSRLFTVQTPQVFQKDLLKAALQAAIESDAAVTDDCAAVERLGKKVYLTDGFEENIKITTPFDLLLADAILRDREGLQ